MKNKPKKPIELSIPTDTEIQELAELAELADLPPISIYDITETYHVDFVEPKKAKITAFHGVFEDKLNKIIIRINKLRKDPNSKSKVKALIVEAKALKKLIKKDKKESYNHTIHLPIHIVDEQIVIDESESSDRVKISDIRHVGGLLIIEFDMKPLE